MTSDIQTWTDGYLELRASAADARGVDDEGETSWPRTTGADVIDIAAQFDEAIRCDGSPGLRRRWDMRLHELERVALASPAKAYAHNPELWSTLEAAAVYLDDVAAAVPDAETWTALVEQLGQLAQLRNAGPSSDGPFGHFENIKTYDDMFLAQYKLLRDKHGSDDLAAPPGMSGGTRPIPRSTNAEVMQLATYWTAELTKAKHVMGYDGVVARWQLAVADVDKLAKQGKPDGAYAKNNELWRAIQEVAIQIAVGDEAPSNWDLAVSSLKDSASHLPESLEQAAAKGAELVASAAHAIGKVANEAGRGLFAGFGTPLLLGAGLLGVFLIARRHGNEEE